MGESVKITAIETHIIGNPWKNWVLVKVLTDDGAFGWGDATSSSSPLAVHGAVTEISRFCNGKDPLSPRRVWEEMFIALNLPVRGVILSAMAGIETACWDILGKSLGAPLHRLLGGTVNERIKAYANGWYKGPRDPSFFAERAAEVATLGYRALKFDPFGANYRILDATERRLVMSLVQSVRDAVGPDVDILIETHDRLTVPEAIRVAEELSAFGVTWMEAPVWAHDVSALTKVAELTTMRIVAGERFTNLRSFADLLACGRIDVVQPEYIELGGVFRLVQSAAIAESYQAMIAPHNARSPLSTAVNVHVDTAVRNVFIQETFNDFHVAWANDIFEGLPLVRDGYFTASDGPGLGVSVNEKEMRKYPYSENNFMRMFKPGWEARFAEDTLAS